MIAKDGVPRITTVSAHTRQILTSYVDAQKPLATWPIKTI